LDKIKVTAVSYLNTKPLLYGLLKSELSPQIDLNLDIPSSCAQKLKTGEAQLGLVPVAIIPELASSHIISDFCIGTIGAVKTVAIYSDLPIEQVEKLYLDFHSRTSVELTKILLKEYWQLSPQLIAASPGYIDQIEGTTAGLVIGDRTIGLEEKYNFHYDLGQVWMDYTGLPFVFAAWVSTKQLSDTFIEQFNKALRSGIDAIPELMYLIPSPDPTFDLHDYFTNYISYTLDEKKKQALKRFLQTIDPKSDHPLDLRLNTTIG
jgi:chorismate dehydratase